MQDGLIYKSSEVLLVRVERGEGMHAMILGVIRSYLLVKMQSCMCGSTRRSVSFQDCNAVAMLAIEHSISGKTMFHMYLVSSQLVSMASVRRVRRECVRQPGVTRRGRRHALSTTEQALI
jgi:hypothetical protein